MSSLKYKVAGALLVTALATGGVAPSQAAAMDLEVGARAGASWNLLSQPQDRVGEWTLLYGSAFTGYGFVVGPEVSLSLGQVAGAELRFLGDLLYGFHQGSGFEEHANGARIDVTLVAHVIRLPLLVQAVGEGEAFRPALALGVEPFLGLMSGATVAQQNISTPPQPLETTPSSGLALLASIGGILERGDMVIPVDLRVAWNPLVPSTTVERFEGFESSSDPGTYRVAFDWQVLLTAGVRFKLGD